MTEVTKKAVSIILKQEGEINCFEDAMNQVKNGVTAEEWWEFSNTSVFAILKSITVEELILLTKEV